MCVCMYVLVTSTDREEESSRAKRRLLILGYKIERKGAARCVVVVYFGGGASVGSVLVVCEGAREEGGVGNGCGRIVGAYGWV